MFPSHTCSKRRCLYIGLARLVMWIATRYHCTWLPLWLVFLLLCSLHLSCNLSILWTSPVCVCVFWLNGRTCNRLSFHISLFLSSLPFFISSPPHYILSFRQICTSGDPHSCKLPHVPTSLPTHRTFASAEHSFVSPCLSSVWNIV